MQGIGAAKNGINLYRGRSHGCIYCDSQSRCYQIEHGFLRILKLRQPLLNCWKMLLNEKFMLGYSFYNIQLENKIGNIRKALNLAIRMVVGFSLITKSHRVLQLREF